MKLTPFHLAIPVHDIELCRKFYKDILNKKSIMELCPSNDDIWLNWMVKLNNSKIKYSGIDKEFTMIKIIKSGLFKKNVKQNFNDIQIKRIIEKYGFPFI